MAKPYDDDLRRNFLAAYDRGEGSIRVLSARFGVSVPWGWKISAAHKVRGVQQRIEAAGAEWLYLPPYSPDLNPIEKAWSKLKQLLRTARARTKEALDQAITELASADHTRECRGLVQTPPRHYTVIVEMR